MKRIEKEEFIRLVLDEEWDWDIIATRIADRWDDAEDAAFDRGVIAAQEDGA